MKLEIPPVIAKNVARLPDLAQLPVLTQILSGGRVPPGLRAAAAGVAGVAAVYAANRLLDSLVQGNPLFGRSSSEWTHWDREIVLITGGSSGIGRLLVDEFARRGIQVVIFDVQPLVGTTTGKTGVAASSASSMPGNIHYYQVDITSDEAVHEAAERVRRDVGEPSVLINNAGIGFGHTLLDDGSSRGIGSSSSISRSGSGGNSNGISTTASENMRRVFAVNAIAPIVMIREFVPAMVRAKHGHVVTMASMASFVPIANNVDYSCTKASVLALHEGLRQELKHRYNASAVRTSIVHPLWVRTPLIEELITTKNFRQPVMEPEVVVDAVLKLVLSGRSDQVILPSRMRGAALVRALPLWMQESLRDSVADVILV